MKSKIYLKAIADVKKLIDRLTFHVEPNWDHVNADVLKHYIEEELEK